MVRFKLTLIPKPIIYKSEQHLLNGSLFECSAAGYIIVTGTLIAKIFWYRKQENLISLKIPYL